MIKFLLVPLILIFSGVLIPDSFSETIEDNLQDAQKLQYFGKYNQALQVYDAILQIEPDNPIVLKNKGYLLNEHGKYDEALITFYSMLNFYPNNSDSLTGIGIALSNLGEYNSAIYFFEKATSLEPTNTLAHSYQNQIIHITEKYPYIDTSKTFDMEQILENKQSFKKFVKKIYKNIASEKRFIQTMNPSTDVWNDYNNNNKNWELTKVKNFPKPQVIKSGIPILMYNVFINDMPRNMPFDYNKLISQSLNYWKSQSIILNGQEFVVDFSYTENKNNANIWIDITAKDLPNLGEATLGKGMAHISLGDFSCNNSFELYDEKTITHILQHEIGHLIGLEHSLDKNNVMYDMILPYYAFCPILFEE